MIHSKEKDTHFAYLLMLDLYETVHIVSDGKITLYEDDILELVSIDSNPLTLKTTRNKIKEMAMRVLISQWNSR